MFLGHSVLWLRPAERRSALGPNRLNSTCSRDRWTHWADSHAAEFAARQWLLSKYEVSDEIAWPRAKIDLLIDMLWERLGMRPGQRVVELCCGGGWLVGHLARRGAVGMGLDFAEGMIRAARSAWPGVPFMVADASACPLPDGCADAVLCYFALINIESERVRRAIVQEAHRLLKPGGRAVIGHLPLRDGSANYDAAKARYSALHPALTNGGLREDCRMPIVLFTPGELLHLASAFSAKRLEPSFNHFWLPGEPPTCSWRLDLCLTR
jgi:SAM-dependent methyltransferase